MAKSKEVITEKKVKPIEQSEQMEGTSLNQREIQLQKLREAFPEAVSEKGIDLEKLRLTLGDDVALTNERYVQLGNHQLKTNTVLQRKLARRSPDVFTWDVGGDAGVKFRDDLT